jgi:hypothetical protein
LYVPEEEKGLRLSGGMLDEVVADSEGPYGISEQKMKISPPKENGVRAVWHRSGADTGLCVREGGV